MEMAKAEGAEVIVMCNNIESQIAELEDPADRAVFMDEYKMTEPALNRLIQSACRENGKLRIEGKEYIVKDGDVMHFRFNV